MLYDHKLAFCAYHWEFCIQAILRYLSIYYSSSLSGFNKEHQCESYNKKGHSTKYKYETQCYNIDKLFDINSLKLELELGLATASILHRTRSNE